MRIEQKQVEVTDAVLSLSKKANLAVGFSSTHSGVPANEQEYLDHVKYDDGAVPFTWAQVKAEIELLQQEANANQYKYDRLNEYPSIEDQLDLIYHNGIDAWKDKIQEIKDKYPKA